MATEDQNCGSYDNGDREESLFDWAQRSDLLSAHFHGMVQHRCASVMLTWIMKSDMAEAFEMNNYLCP